MPCTCHTVTQQGLSTSSPLIGMCLRDCAVVTPRLLQLVLLKTAVIIRTYVHTYMYVRYICCSWCWTNCKNNGSICLRSYLQLQFVSTYVCTWLFVLIYVSSQTRKSSVMGCKCTLVTLITVNLIHNHVGASSNWETHGTHALISQLTLLVSTPFSLLSVSDWLPFTLPLCFITVCYNNMMLNDI